MEKKKSDVIYTVVERDYPKYYINNEQVGNC